MKKYCYHITDGITRSALQCGTVTASSMEEAAEQVAKRAGLVMTQPDDGDGIPYWTKDGARRNVYVLHDPKPATPKPLTESEDAILSPLPWKLRLDKVVDAEGKAVCRCTYRLNGPDNYTVLAAAPDLLEALQNLVADWELAQDRPIPDDHEAKAAIAKARGEA